MRKVIVMAVVSLGLLSACSSKEPAATSGGTPSPGATGTKPVVTVPKGPAPKDLVVTDLVTGTGAEAKNGTRVTVHYVGVHFEGGAQFDASWDGGQPFTLSLPGQVIEGWNKGIPGMRAGGRRMLVIPPALAYGAQGYPPTIQPNETLVFVIDLLSVA